MAKIIDFNLLKSHGPLLHIVLILTNSNDTLLDDSASVGCYSAVVQALVDLHGVLYEACGDVVDSLGNIGRQRL